MRKEAERRNTCGVLSGTEFAACEFSHLCMFTLWSSSSPPPPTHPCSQEQGGCHTGKQQEIKKAQKGKVAWTE